MADIRPEDIHVPNSNQGLAMDLLADWMAMCEQLFGLHEGEVSAIIGQVYGKYAACIDDCAAHDAEWVQKMKDSTAAEGRKETLNPCRDTFMLNFETAYAEHQQKHDRLRETMKLGETMLNNLCESHTAQKKG